MSWFGKPKKKYVVPISASPAYSGFSTLSVSSCTINMSNISTMSSAVNFMSLSSPDNVNAMEEVLRELGYDHSLDIYDIFEVASKNEAVKKQLSDLLILYTLAKPSQKVQDGG